MKKIAIVITILFLVSICASPAMAWSTGDRVYAIFGSGSSARVEAGHVVSPGSSRSQVEWDSCSNCSQWTRNSAFYYDGAAAQRRVKQMDAEHTSVGEVVGTAAGIGIGILLLKMLVEN